MTTKQELHVAMRFSAERTAQLKKIIAKKNRIAKKAGLPEVSPSGVIHSWILAALDRESREK